MLGFQNYLDVEVCKDAGDAVARGHFYHEGYKLLTITKAVVVQNGTEQGNPTVDLVLQGEDGQKYVVMVTGNLLKMLPI